MTSGHWVLGAAGVVGLSLLVWKSFRCFLQGRRLLRWRRASFEGVVDLPASIRGTVRVKQPLKVSDLGNCLWHREVTQTHTPGGKGTTITKTVSDIAKKARFSIVIDGREFLVADEPTLVYGARARRNFGGDRTVRTYWIPVLEYLTILGRVRQRGEGYSILKDPKVGLIYSVHPAEHTAHREFAKAGLCLALFALGVTALYLFLTGPPPK